MPKSFMDFLFHKVSEKEKEEIRKQAKKIMDDFSKQLSKIDQNKEEPIIERKEFERNEKEVKVDESFSREIMFKNAQNKNKDFIVAEKGEW
jgi:Asp-tRNA(Asn)/Glu-tRNA(Gln) amidotransferase C subunit